METSDVEGVTELDFPAAAGLLGREAEDTGLGRLEGSAGLFIPEAGFAEEAEPVYRCPLAGGNLFEWLLDGTDEGGLSRDAPGPGPGADAMGRADEAERGGAVTVR